MSALCDTSFRSLQYRVLCTFLCFIVVVALREKTSGEAITVYNAYNVSDKRSYGGF